MAPSRTGTADDGYRAVGVVGGLLGAVGGEIGDTCGVPTAEAVAWSGTADGGVVESLHHWAAAAAAAAGGGDGDGAGGGYCGGDVGGCGDAWAGTCIGGMLGVGECELVDCIGQG